MKEYTKYASNLLESFEHDVEQYKRVQDKNSFLSDLKSKIKETTKQYFETQDVELRKEIVKELSRCYNLLYYIQGTTGPKTYVLDEDIEHLPNVFILDQKPERFPNDYSLISEIDHIDPQKGISQEQAEQLLRWTVNNTRDSLNKDNSKRESKSNVYENDSTGGACGLSQFISLYPLQKLGLKVTINNICEIGGCRHAYGTVVIPINNNGNVEKKRYLIDCTYRQFFTVPRNVFSFFMHSTPDTGFFVVYDDKETEFAKELIKNGYVEASEDNLKKYLRPFYLQKIIGKEIYHDEFAKIDIIDMLENQQVEFDYTEEEMHKWGINLNIKSNKDLEKASE